MTKEEFIITFRRFLAGELATNEIDEHATYYENYIAMEIGKGKKVEEVLEQLGDPRLLAKTIIEVNKEKVESGQTNSYSSSNTSSNGQKKGLPRWLVSSIVVSLLVLIIIVVFRLFFLFLPVLIVIFIVSYIIRLFKYN